LLRFIIGKRGKEKETSFVNLNATFSTPEDGGENEESFCQYQSQRKRGRCGTSRLSWLKKGGGGVKSYIILYGGGGKTLVAA